VLRRARHTICYVTKKNELICIESANEKAYKESNHENILGEFVIFLALASGIGQTITSVIV